MRIYVGFACLLLLAIPATVPAAEVLQSQTVVESKADGVAVPEEVVIEPLDRVTLTRVVREKQYKGIDVVVLEEPAEDDGFGHLSVDKNTELGRELVRLCPDGARCTITTTIANGTLARIYSIQRAR